MTLNDALMEAAETLIRMVKAIEHHEGARAADVKLTIEVDLTAGGTETWEIVVNHVDTKH